MIAIVLIVMIAPLAICWALWLAFALLGMLPERGTRTPLAVGHVQKVHIDVLIPAHDEEVLLPRLLETLQTQTARGRVGRVLVVADHCSDSTAALARAAGVDVLERSSGPRGKPAALREGLAWLKAKADGGPGRAVMIIDADCVVSENLIEEVVASLERGAKVVQAAYVLESGKQSKDLQSPAMIAFALKNVVRPRGMGRLGLPTQLFGTGMCFREEVLEGITFADHLTEDLKISHDLIVAGIGPVFAARGVVRSPLPAERKGMSTQKLRWETGQVQTWAKLPGLMTRLLLKGRMGGMVALIDWSAPPVAMGILYCFALAVATVLLVALRLTPWWMLVVVGAVFALLVGYVVAGALQIAGIGGTARLFLGVPRFMVWKLGLYGRMMTGRGAKGWQRTERDAAGVQGAPDGGAEARP